MAISFASIILDGKLDSPLCFWQLAIKDNKLIELLVTLEEFIAQVFVQSQAILLVKRSTIGQVVSSRICHSQRWHLGQVEYGLDVVVKHYHKQVLPL